MPLVVPSTGTALDVIDRLAGYVALDSTVNGLFTPPIKTYPMNGIEEADDITVSLHCPDEDYYPATLGITGKMAVQPRIILSVMVFEAGSGADVQARYRLCMSATTAIRDSIQRYHRDPDPAGLWYNLRFYRGQNPTTAYKHEPGRYHLSVTQFEVITQKDKPQ